MSYKTREIVKILDIPQRQVHSFVQRGYVKSSIQEWKGPGTKRLWSFDDICRIRVAMRLVAYGFRVPVIRDLVEEIVQTGGIWGVSVDMEDVKNEVRENIGQERK